jgi:hypothetical protein
MPRFEIAFLTEYTDEALLNELRRIAALLPDGEPLTKPAYKRYSPKVAENTISRRFGGWRDALEKAGLGHLYHGQPVSQKMRLQPARDWSDAELLAELRRVHALVGKQWLTSTNFNANSMTSTESLRRRFGSFHEALEAAGVPNAPHKARQFSEQECFENIADVWTHYGRPPEYREMFELPSRIRGKTYVLRWGIWRKTLKAFVEWANTNEQPTEPSAPVRETNEPSNQVDRTIVVEADCRDVRPGLRFKVFMRDRFRCVACGRSPATSLNTELHADHILAVANGGKTTLENLQTLCQDCNLGKGRTVVPFAT